MYKYILKFKLLFLGNIVAIFLDSLMSICLAFVLKIIVDIGLSGSLEKLKTVSIFAVVYLVVMLSISYIKNFMEALYIKKIMTAIKNDVMSKILNKDIIDFRENNSASYISIINNDLGIIEEDYFTNIISITSSIISLCLAIISLFSLSMALSLGIFVASLVPMVIPALLENIMSKEKKIYSDKLSKFTAKCNDIFNGFDIIKTFSIENKIYNNYKILNNDVEQSRFKFCLFSSLALALSSMSGFIMFFSAVIIGMYLIITNVITMGDMIAAVQIMNNIFSPLMMITMGIAQFNSVKLIGDKILDVLNKNEKSSEDGVEVELEKMISVKNLEFKYSGEEILKDISFDIEKGKKYAIVGSSGSGKSTLIKILGGYYSKYRGQILIDRTEIRQLSQKCRNKLFTLMHQDVYLFNTSIRDNITLFDKYNYQNVIEAVNVCNLIGLIDGLEDGDDTIVGENGAKLSGGEKQRIAIARAIIKEADILLFDEAMSSLDRANSYVIEEHIINDTDKTCLFITHNISEETLSMFDEIIMLDKGKIVDKGSFNELIDKKGMFFSLYMSNNLKEVTNVV